VAKNEMFDSSVRSDGTQAGVFEYDGDTGYFYLYKTKDEQGQKVVASIRVLSGSPDFEEKDIAVRWDAKENIVGLFICGKLWAAFDGGTFMKYGGDYCASVSPQIPQEIIKAFNPQ